MISNRSGFTKSGFSKQGIDACGFHLKCNLGKNECYWSKIDPEVKNYCTCYKRNHVDHNSGSKGEDNPLFSIYNVEEIKDYFDLLVKNKELVGVLRVNSIGLKMGEKVIIRPTTYMKNPSMKCGYIYDLEGNFKGRDYLKNYVVLRDDNNENSTTGESNDSAQYVDSIDNNSFEQLSLF